MTRPTSFLLSRAPVTSDEPKVSNRCRKQEEEKEDEMTGVVAKQVFLSCCFPRISTHLAASSYVRFQSHLVRLIVCSHLSPSTHGSLHVFHPPLFSASCHAARRTLLPTRTEASYANVLHRTL